MSYRAGDSQLYAPWYGEFGMARLVDAGYIYPHGLVDGHGHGCWDYLQYPPSLFPQNHQALVRLQLLSAVQHMHERLPFLSGEEWDGMAR